MTVKLKDGSILGWGSNKHNQFRLTEREVKRPTMIFDGNVNKISKVECGHSHLIVMCKKELIFGEFLKEDEIVTSQQATAERYEETKLIKKNAESDVELAMWNNQI